MPARSSGRESSGSKTTGSSASEASLRTEHRRYRSRGRHPAARPDGHGGQPPDGRARRESRAVPGAGRSPDPGAARGRQFPPHAARGLHHGAQPRIVRQDRRLPARRRARQGHRRGVDRRAAGDPRRSRDHADRWAPRSDDVRRVHAGCAGADGRGGHRQRRRRDPQSRALPDQARRPADQGLLLRRCHVADRRGRRTTLFGRGAGRDRRRGAPARAARRGAHAWRRGGQARRRSAGSTASSTAS